MVQLLVDSGIDVNVPDQCGRTVLSHVTMLSVDTPRMVELLLSARAIVNWTDGLKVGMMILDKGQNFRNIN